MAAEEEMVSLISTTPVKALGSAADIVVQLLRFLNDTHISSATGRVVKGVSGAAASAGKGAYNAATRGIEGLGREGTVSMHVLRRVADEAGIDSRLVPVPRDFMGALAKEHNLDDDAMWSVVKKRLTEAGIMHARVRRHRHRRLGHARRGRDRLHPGVRHERGQDLRRHPTLRLRRRRGASRMAARPR